LRFPGIDRKIIEEYNPFRKNFFISSKELFLIRGCILWKILLKFSTDYGDDLRATEEIDPLSLLLEKSALVILFFSDLPGAGIYQFSKRD
jgi:hypothetical protein